MASRRADRRDDITTEGARVPVRPGPSALPPGEGVLMFDRESESARIYVSRGDGSEVEVYYLAAINSNDAARGQVPIVTGAQIEPTTTPPIGDADLSIRSYRWNPDPVDIQMAGPFPLSTLGLATVGNTSTNLAITATAGGSVGDQAGFYVTGSSVGLVGASGTPVFKAKITTPPSLPFANSVITVGFWQSGSAPNHVPESSSNKRAAFRLKTSSSTEWFVTVHDGSTGTEVNTGITAAADTTYEMEIRVTIDSGVLFLIDGQTVAVIDSPSPLSADQYDPVVINANRTTSSPVSISAHGVYVRGT